MSSFCTCGGASCSECVGPAACNPVLCGTCLTGNVPPDAICTPIAIDPTTFSPDCALLPPGSGTPIDGTADCQYVICSPCEPGANPNACAAVTETCLPCSPLSDGASDQPPATSGAACNRVKGGGNSGGGSAGSSGGSGAAAKQPTTASQNNTSALARLLSRLGATTTGLFGGGTRVPAKNILPGQAISRNSVTPISPNAFLLIIIVVGVLLLMLSFGKGGD